MAENKFEFVEETPTETLETENQMVEPEAMEDPTGDPFQDILTMSNNDPLEELTGDQSTQQEATETSTEPPQAIAEGEQLPKENPDSFQYWQSQADMAKGNLEKTEAELERYRQLEPLANYLSSNPQVLDTIEASIKGEAPAQETSEKPQRPAKPGNYDPVDAYSDPESGSYKYRESLDDYRDQMIEYQEGSLSRQRERIEQEAAHRNQAMQMDSLKAQLMNAHEYSSDAADSFIQKFSDPSSISLENLIALDRLQAAPSEEVLKNQRKAEEMRRQKEKLSIQKPVAVAPAESRQEAPMEDRLMEAMVNTHEKLNPWT